MQKGDPGSLPGFSEPLDEARFERPANTGRLTAIPNSASASRCTSRSCGVTDASGTSARFWREHVLWQFCSLASCPIHAVRHHDLPIGLTWLDEDVRPTRLLEPYYAGVAIRRVSSLEETAWRIPTASTACALPP